MKTYAYGFPRLGENREYKKAIETFWEGEGSEEGLNHTLHELQANMLQIYASAVNVFPVGEMTAYDPMLDTAVMLGVYKPKNLQEYYELCRGAGALEMTKWFNTNYHYLVSDFSAVKSPSFELHWNKPQQYRERFGKGIPYVIGPFTFLKLSKGLSKTQFKSALEDLTGVYRSLFTSLQEVHVDEPALVLELFSDEIEGVKKAYEILGQSAKVHLFTYYEQVDFLKQLYDLPVASLGLDFVHGIKNLQTIKKYGFPKDKTLIAGVVDGRNIWKNDIRHSVETLKALSRQAKSIWVSNAGPLFHLPITTEGEHLDSRLMGNLAFAKQKLQEIGTIAACAQGRQKVKVPSDSGVRVLGQNKKVQTRIKTLTTKDFKKLVPLAKRRAIQDKILHLPSFPTTTIGSFPQTPEVRKYRADYRAGRITEQEYNAFVQREIRQLMKFQEEQGLDVPVHGEFERTDMVEFFAEQLDGVATTANGWIISYGTRAYRPPIIFGDISRPRPMTVKEIVYAQSLTNKPVKGMLTGAVTIIAWSFVREDIPIKDVAYQISLALRDEIHDYEKAGIKIVQVDEPAIRERAPIKRGDWPKYFDWAIKSFRLATNTAPETQIHTHMCYSEFGEIIKQIDAMDFDVISIESTRSRGDIIKNFERIDFKKQIGLGVWDIHSPAIPTVEQMKQVAQRALRVIPKRNFWINPDCGLKTRGWPETEASLKNLVTLASQLRHQK
ncbi:MAG: 5-methyltetrahydropteroyltriglutamate--homocysteine S-methyltransferase [Candidatus Omnitrophica bacterium]|nr:5-methyltetrahydropteroyltriglutamate--homocysteine S-methyltransferase [Candidatus Omnitrophota bacterium]